MEVQNNLNTHLFEITVPELGESVTEATVGQWLVQEGELLSTDQILCELETDKVAVEVRAPSAGILRQITAKTGNIVKIGGLIAFIDPQSSGKLSPNIIQKTPDAQSNITGDIPAPPQKTRDIEHAPSAKIMMAHNQISSADVEGTGKDGRVMKDDVVRVLKKAETTTVQAFPADKTLSGNATPNSTIRRVPMSRLRQTIAKRLKNAQNTAAILTTYNEVDMSEIMRLRSEYKDEFSDKYGAKLGFMSFFIKACIRALQEIPAVNASLDGTDILYNDSYNIGVAVAVDNGLIVPVIKDAEKMDFSDIEKKLTELGKKARENKLSVSELQGGTFTISNGGIYGSLMSAPILNPPQSGILGMHKIQERPVVINGEIVIRPMMYLALSYDHRIIDGREAVTFLVHVKKAIENPYRLLFSI